jgi:hypothetical protein
MGRPVRHSVGVWDGGGSLLCVSFSRALMTGALFPLPRGHVVELP